MIRFGDLIAEIDAMRVLRRTTAIAAKEGKLPTKPKKMSQSELRGEIMSAFVQKYPKEAALMMALSMHGYGRRQDDV